jgi:hypothetical protein
MEEAEVRAGLAGRAVVVQAGRAEVGVDADADDARAEGLEAEGRRGRAEAGQVEEGRPTLLICF